MFRDLARMTASLKGPCYEGALIARAVWERGEDGAGSGMRILRDHHGLLEVVAYDGSGRLTVTMMLGRSAPTRERAKGRALSLLVDGTPAKEQLSLCFSAEAVHAFVQSVGDTNALWPYSKQHYCSSLEMMCVAQSCASVARPLPGRRSR